ncbi:MAG: allophanate hydrolase subunit 1, partial [Chloroflexi bacterium]
MPAYASLLCHFDPAVTDVDRLGDVIRRFDRQLDASIPAGTLVDIPTSYDGADLAEVARKTNMTPG